MDIGKRLKEIRISKGLLQKDVAKSIGISKARLSNYEMNKRKPSIEIIAKISRFYNVSVDYLLFLIDSSDQVVREMPEPSQVFRKVGGQSIESQIGNIMNVKEIFDSLDGFETPYLTRISLILESAIEELEQKKKIEEIHSFLINK